MKLKKFILSPWSFIPIIGIFLLSRFLEKKGIVSPVIYSWNPIDLGYFALGIFALWIIIKSSRKKSKKIDYDDLPGRPDISPPYYDEETELN
jgi:hypothetical protein